MRVRSVKTENPPAFRKQKVRLGRANRLAGNFQQRRAFSNALDESSYMQEPPADSFDDSQIPDVQLTDTAPGGADARSPNPDKPQTPRYTVDNGATERFLDVSATTLGELRQVVGTLITDLKTLKLGIN